MARGIFGRRPSPEEKVLREIDKRESEKENEPPEAEEGSEEESPEEAEARKKLIAEAAARYETGIGKQPVEVKTAEQLAPYLENEFEKISAAHQAELAEEHNPGGLKSRRISRGWERGHRHGLKKKRAKGGEPLSPAKAA
jgi:hypothetical protein